MTSLIKYNLFTDHKARYCCFIPKSCCKIEQCNQEVSCYEHRYCSCMPNNWYIPHGCNTSSYSFSHWLSFCITFYPNNTGETNMDLCDWFCTISCSPIKLPFMILCSPYCCYKECNGL